MLDSALFPNGSRYIPRKTQYLSASGTFVAPAKGKVALLAVAPGASGAAASSSIAGPVVCTGGGAGENATDWMDVEAGATFTAMLGNPGASVSVTGTAANGNNGGNTVISGPNGYSLSVVGGKKGVTTSGTTAAVSGGDGGTGGTGGTANVVRSRGGRGGGVINIQANASIANRRATGGGGVNMVFATTQDVTRGGDISATSGTACASGGAGCGGAGGDNTVGGSDYAGGGYGGAASAHQPGPNAVGQRTQASPAGLVPGLACFGVDHFGGGGTSTFAAGPGGGSSANSALSAGIFGGTSGYAGVSSSDPPNQGAVLPGAGAGSGGAVSQSSSLTATTAPGGNSFVVFIFLQEVIG